MTLKKEAKLDWKEKVKEVANEVMEEIK